MTPLLSVIIPCYNVEKFIDKCLSSIVVQTYNNLEIILINDGSTDTTGDICDVWQKRDSRIQVIHKQNEGASNARKDGVNIASGQFITFADADDWTEPRMYSDMMTALINTNSDIAMCSFCYVWEDGRIEHNVPEDLKGKNEIVPRKEAVLLLLDNQKWYSVMWDKIFKKSLFENIDFPEGRGLADDFVTLFLFHKANQVVYLHNEYYYYLQRKGSICNPNDIVLAQKNFIDHSDAYFERYMFVLQHPEYHAALPFVKYETIKFTLKLLRHIILSNNHFSDNYFKNKVEQLRTIPITRNDNLTRRLKLELKVLKISKRLYKVLIKICYSSDFCTSSAKPKI
ncbi:MAG: glycosyltransferase [Marinilabiliaceae bacterium]|nr:glycosyltransferase [Marinilabiliaceae bacterium]